MVIKLKRQAARLPVKTCCFVLIIAMTFVFLAGLVEISRIDVDYIDESLIFTSFDDCNYFYDQYAFLAFDRVLTVFAYKSEDNIRDMGNLNWSLAETYYTEQGEQMYQLTSKGLFNSQQSYGTVSQSDRNGTDAKTIEMNAINDQLQSFTYAKEWLDSQAGLYYYISDKFSGTLTNTGNTDSSFFANQPVYMIHNKGRLQESSRSGLASYPYSYDMFFDSVNSDTSVLPDDYPDIMIAYSEEAVSAQNAVWQAAQGRMHLIFGLMSASLLLMLALLIILLTGAGRRSGADYEKIQLIVLDKPFLDLGLVTLAGYEIGLTVFVVFCIEAAWPYKSYGWIYALCAFFAVFSISALLCWITSFAKRCKTGKWWRHTLIFWLLNKLWCAIKSLWAGVTLTIRCAVGGVGLLFSLVITAALGNGSPGLAIFFGLVVTSAALILSLRYAKRLHTLAQGARLASSGNNYDPIDVKGGVLGSIASYINSISDGINAAVSERMKSERLKTELLTNVSHDIRTPLTSLITYADLLKTGGLNNEKAPEYLEVMIQKSARLRSLTDDLFEAAKAASGNIEVKLETLDLADFVRQVFGELSERVEESGLDFRLYLPEHAIVRADGRLMWRVVENLLSNVFKYALGGSRVYISVSAQDICVQLEIKNISDMPLNVDPSELTERFKRGDESRAGDGSGLGLSIAQSFVHAQGGQFKLSIDGDLFKVTVLLPKELP